jgi:SAM-dependent methyltransferase
VSTGDIRGTVLDLGSRNVQDMEGGNARLFCERHGLDWEGADLEAGRDVSFTLDVLDREQVHGVARTWTTIIAMNLYEHLYDPIRGLENTLELVEDGGAVVVVTPTVWELHDFPKDYWRPLPDFYLDFAERNSCVVREPRWIVGGRIVPWERMMRGKQKLIPSKNQDIEMHGAWKALRSRLVHRAFGTSGRQSFFPYSALGVCIRREG